MGKPVDRSSGTRRRRWIMLAVGVALLAILLSRVSPRTIVEVLGRAAPLPILLATALSLTAAPLRTIRYGVFFGARGRFLRIYGAFALLRLMQIVFPFRSGELAFLALLKRHRLSPSMTETAPVWLLIRATDAAALGLWLGIAATWTAAGKRLGNAGVVGPLVVVALIVFFVLGLRWASRYRPQDENGPIARRLVLLRAGFERLRDPFAMGKAAGLAALIWILIMCGPALVLQALDAPLSFADGLLVTSLALAVSLLPINAPLNLGTGEATWAALLTLFGVGFEEAVALAVGVRLWALLTVAFDGALGSFLLGHAPVADPE